MRIGGSGTEPQPPPAAKTEFLADISAMLVRARNAIGDQGRVGLMRRLNRREYVNTIVDVLGVEPDASSLPDDKGTGTFDTIGSSLFISGDQLEAYLAVGRSAAAAAVVNSLLASYYGLTDNGRPVAGMEFRRVALPEKSPRGGLIGMAAILAIPEFHTK